MTFNPQKLIKIIIVARFLFSSRLVTKLKLMLVVGLILISLTIKFQFLSPELIHYFVISLSFKNSHFKIIVRHKSDKKNHFQIFCINKYWKTKHVFFSTLFKLIDLSINFIFIFPFLNSIKDHYSSIWLRPLQQTLYFEEIINRTWNG